MNRSFVALLIVLSSTAQAASWKVLTLKDGESSQIIDVIESSQNLNEEILSLRSLPEKLPEHAMPSTTFYEETLYSEQALPPEAKRFLSQRVSSLASWPGSEVRTLVDQGPASNRIKITIVGDGYTAHEKEEFFEDALRITNDLFTVETFSSYLALFNVTAVFVPSVDSGISDTVQKNTALGLYRDPPGSKRAIMPGNTTNIERALALAPTRADYPILLANDDYYGGLGGRYAITTRSVQSGSVVLRHELGHNFGNVGEEYDGGMVYSGANHSSTRNVPWKHWLADDFEIHEAAHLAGDYVWKNLSQGAYASRFTVPDFYSLEKNAVRVGVQISTVGWESPEDVFVYLDGVKVSLSGEITDDRSFFDVSPAASLAPGTHMLEIKENIHDGNNVLAFARVHAFPETYRLDEDFIGAFNSFNSWESQVGYRPTHQSCLMRDMTTKKFCPIDRENMWKRFLNNVSLIDSIDVGQAAADGTQPVNLKALKVEGLDIRWYRLEGLASESELVELRGQSSWDAMPGRYRVKVELKTPEVRMPSARFRVSRDFSV